MGRQESMTKCRHAPSITPLAIGEPSRRYSSYRIRSLWLENYLNMTSSCDFFFGESSAPGERSLIHT